MSHAVIAGLLLAMPIRLRSVGPLLFISAAIMGSPGPATISLVAAGSACGVKRAFAYLTGIILGTTTVLVAVATGITAALLAVPWIGSILIAVSAACILWLTYHIALAPPISVPIPAPRGFSLLGGTLLGIVNPKAWVAIAAVFASTRLADTPAMDAAAKLVLLAAMIIAICASWLVAGSALARFLSDNRRARVVNLGLALALLGSTALLFLH